jgi:hypothetical protein
MMKAAPTPRAGQIAPERGRPLVALIGGLAPSGSASRPLPDETVVLADAGFVLKPDLDRLALRI